MAPKHLWPAKWLTSPFVDRPAAMAGPAKIHQWHRLGKNKLHELRSVQLFFWFSAKFVNISDKFEFLNMQIRNNLKNVIFIACKWCKIYKYSVNSMVISHSYCEKEEKECIWVKYLIYAVLSRFQICCNSLVFFRKIWNPKFQSSQKKLFFPSLQWHCTSLMFYEEYSPSKYFILISGHKGLFSYLSVLQTMSPLDVRIKVFMAPFTFPLCGA